VPPVPPVPPEPEPEFAPPEEAGEPTLRLGDNSVDGWVEYLQEALNLAGFGPVTVDGAFGNGTHAALLAFQQAAGIMVDGVAGNQTWAALRGETPQAPSTDGREPHTFVEIGQEARWLTEQSDNLIVGSDFVQIFAVSTGDVPINTGEFTAVARITQPSGAQHVVELNLDTFGEPAGQGGIFSFLTDASLVQEPGDYTIEVYMPAELGGDESVQSFNVPG
jgi:peptidoglycan hydrolase-like protein with peptidoglycan-binding domain